MKCPDDVAMLLAFEAGYKACEKGQNIQLAISNFKQTLYAAEKEKVMVRTEFIKGHDSSFSIRVGDKVSPVTFYQGIASLEVDGVLYIAVSQYWDGTLPPEQVLVVRRVSDIEREQEAVPA